MKKTILELGKTLSREAQRNVNGGGKRAFKGDEGTGCAEIDDPRYGSQPGCPGYDGGSFGDRSF